MHIKFRKKKELYIDPVKKEHHINAEEKIRMGYSATTKKKMRHMTRDKHACRSRSTGWLIGAGGTHD